MSTVTVWPPGLIVSGVPTVASPDASTVIVTLWPAASEPDVCERLMLPSSPDGTAMDQLTGPPLAVSVNEALLPTASAMLLVDTDRVPCVVPEFAEPDGDELGEDDGDEDGEDVGLADAEPDDPELELEDGVLDDVGVEVALAPRVDEAEASVLPPRVAADEPAPVTGVPAALADAEVRAGPIVMVLPCTVAECELIGALDVEAAAGITAVIGVDESPVVVAAT
jgi:hypothetical protein